MNKLFIVEDEEIIRKGLVSNIPWKTWGFEVCGEAVNGREALAYILEHDVDVVMTDVRMPVMDGLDLARLIKEAKPSVKIVVLTGFSEFEYARQSLEYGVFQYVLKPIKKDKLTELFRQLRDLLDRERIERDQTITLRSKLEESRRLLTDKQLNDWLHGRLEENAAGELADALHWKMQSANMVCVVADIDNIGKCDREFVSGYKQYGARTMRVMSEQAIAGAALAFPVHLAWDDYGRLVLLANASGRQGAAGLDRLTREITDRCGIVWNAAATFSAGIGEAAQGMGIQAVPVSYRKAADALVHRFYSGPNSVLQHRDVPGLRPMNQQEFQSIKQTEKKLLTWITMGGDDLDHIWAESFADILRHQTVEYGSVRNAIAQTLYSICGNASEYGFDMDLRMMDGIAMSGLSDLNHILSFAKWIVNEIKSGIDSADPNDSRNLVLQAKQFVKENFMYEVSLTDIANRFYINASYFSWLFKQETGITFTSYLTDVRMETAKRLLKEDTKRVYEVAQCVGYNDYRNFCKTFKKVVGVSPTDYKQRGR